MESTSFASAIYTTLPYFIQLEADYLQEKDQATFDAEKSRQQNRFDFIIGGGTAGCVLANRLSSQFTVLLLEAGGDPPSAASLLLFVIAVSNSPSINYLYQGLPQKHLQNRILDKYAGKMLGGSGSHNGIIYNRGHPRDFDNWAKIVNDTSWKYDELLKFFKRSENYVGIWQQNVNQHGKNGPIHVETDSTIFDFAWKAAAKKLGFKYRDPNGPQQIGFSPVDVTKKQRRRVSAYTAYLHPVLQRKNLTVIRYADVRKLLISEARVIGVQYFRHAKKFKAFASKETVVSAGVFGTPLLLFKSGIGSAKMLRRAGIIVKFNLPAVGKYLQDHIGTTTLPFTPNKAHDIRSKDTLKVEKCEEIIKFGTSHLLSVSAGPQALIASSAAKAKNESSWPDILILKFHCPNILRKEICFAVSANRPTISRALVGSLKLNTTAYRMGERDNVKLALIDDKTLKSRRNRRIIREGLVFARQILRTRALRRIGKLQAVDAECGAQFKANSVRYWNCYITRTAISTFHSVGTCRMGLDAETKRSVVDSKLRVHGIRGLRIVDASVIPVNTNANTNAPVIAIAEKAADMLIRQNLRALT